MQFEKLGITENNFNKLNDNKENAENPKEITADNTKLNTDENKNLVANAPISYQPLSLISENTLMIKDNIDTIKKMLDEFVLKWNKASNEIAEEARQTEAARQAERERQAALARQQREEEQKARNFLNDSDVFHVFAVNNSSIDVFSAYAFTLTTHTNVLGNPKYQFQNMVSKYDYFDISNKVKINLKVKITFDRGLYGNWKNQHSFKLLGTGGNSIEAKFSNLDTEEVYKDTAVFEGNVGLRDAYWILYAFKNNSYINANYNCQTTEVQNAVIKYVSVSMKGLRI